MRFHRFAALLTLLLTLTAHARYLPLPPPPLATSLASSARLS
jgi:hypothetical protein